MSNDKKTESQTRTGLRLELWKIVLSLQPGQGGDSPRSWRIVWQLVQHNLRSICANVVGLLNDTLDAARAILQGLAGKNAPITSDLAHPVVEDSSLIAAAEEVHRQESLRLKQRPAAPLNAVEKQIADFAKLVESRGARLFFVPDRDGFVRVLVVRPDGLEEAWEMLEAERPNRVGPEEVEEGDLID